MTRPIIGLTPHYQTAGCFAEYPWVAVRDAYYQVLYDLGAMPIIFPILGPEPAEVLLDMVDGLLLTGGDFDIPPSMYGEEITSSTVITSDKRTQTELPLLVKALERKMPILGLCAGEQLINVVRGGSLIQDIPSECPDALQHWQPMCRYEPQHEVTVLQGTQLHSIVGCDRLAVNSRHHQAVKRVGNHLRINAVSDDGIVEGVEAVDHPFCIGVQWHPEFLITEGDRRIQQAFIEAVKQYKS